MQLVKMLQTTPGYPDGRTRVTYSEGGEYSLPDDLVTQFIKMGVVELVIEQQAIKAAPQRKRRSRK